MMVALYRKLISNSLAFAQSSVRGVTKHQSNNSFILQSRYFASCLNQAISGSEFLAYQFHAHVLMCVVEAFDLPIPELLLGIGTYNLKLRNPINHIKIFFVNQLSGKYSASHSFLLTS